MSSTLKLFTRAGAPVRTYTTSIFFAVRAEAVGSTSTSSSCCRALPRAHLQHRNSSQLQGNRLRSSAGRQVRQQTQTFATTPIPAQAAKKRAPSHQRAAKLASTDRGPKSSEDTVTDFGALNVLGQTPNPSTSVDICAFDGFMLDSGLRIGDGDGVVLLGKEAFVWRPWMAGAAVDAESGIVTGNMLRKAAGKQATDAVKTGGIVNGKGQWEVPDAAWAILRAVATKPDLLIVGTGPTIRPLAPATRNYLQELGLRIEVLDTRNAASQFNLLATERGVEDIAAVMVPIGFGVN